MLNDTRMDLFTKTDTTLVYIASRQFARDLKGCDCNNLLYIHVKRDTGHVVIYEDNNINKVVPIDMKEQECILQSAENDR